MATSPAQDSEADPSVTPVFPLDAHDAADRLFNAVIVLYGSAKELRFGEAESEDADLHRQVLERVRNDLGPWLLEKVEQAIERRAAQ